MAATRFKRRFSIQSNVSRLVFIGVLLTIFVVASAELQIRNNGIEHIERRDVGMVFFVEVRNVGKQPVALSVRMIKCCETICVDDVDCEHIQLIGGDMGTLNPHGMRNLTLVWPTLYLHNRVGECVVGISYMGKNNQTGELRQKIQFDTTVSRRHVPPILEGYYDPFNVETCATVDLDALDSCRPVNCHIKYSGKRNFFNRKLQKCQIVPICIADNGKELPDVEFVPNVTYVMLIHENLGSSLEFDTLVWTAKSTRLQIYMALSGNRTLSGLGTRT